MMPFLLTFRESLEIVLQVLLVVSILNRGNKIYIASIVSILAGAISAAFYSHDIFISKALTGLSFLFYLFCIILPVAAPSETAVVLMTPLFFLPHSFELTSVLINKAYLSGRSVYIQGLIGALLSISVFYMIKRYLLRNMQLQGFLHHREVFLLIATFNLLFGGNREFSDASMIPYIQSLLTGLITGLIGLISGQLLFPDVQVFDTTLKGLFDFLASPRFSMAIITILILFPPVYLLLNLLLSQEPELDGFEKKAMIRKKISLYRGQLYKRGIPLIFSFASLIFLIHGANLVINPVYEPRPIGLTQEDGLLKIPLMDSSGDISDQKLRKYTFLKDGNSYRILVMMRPDGEVVATLDACEICPPIGYVQKGRYLICKYCNTPIPPESFGKAGGCNPIPLPYRVNGDTLILNVQEIVETSKMIGSKFTGRH
jgi:hypothetical protein